ncbi:MAG: hypothetical protein ACLQHF_07570 [Terracidiphilus sp.]
MYQPVKPSRFLAVVVLVVPACFGQTGPQLTPLRILEETPIPTLQVSSMGLRAVAGDGEFYVQTGLGKYTAVDLEGETHVALDISKVPATDSMNPQDLFVVDLAQAPRGGVIAVVWWNETPKAQRAGVLRFDEHGDFSSLLWLDAAFIPTHVAEFSSAGDFLVTGYDEHSKVHVALVNSRGTMVIPQVLPYGDAEVASGNKAPGQAGQPSDQSIREASLIQLVSGDDNAVYLYNPSFGRKVIRIQPSGQSTEIALPPPFPEGESTLPLQMYVSHSSLYLYEAILDKGQKTEEVTELKRFAISVYDRYSGTLNASFRVDSGSGLIPVALSPKEFHLLDAKVLPGGELSFSLIRSGP